VYVRDERRDGGNAKGSTHGVSANQWGGWDAFRTTREKRCPDILQFSLTPFVVQPRGKRAESRIYRAYRCYGSMLNILAPIINNALWAVLPSFYAMAQLVRNWGDCFSLTGCSPIITGTSSSPGEINRALQGLGRCTTQTFDRGLCT